MEPREAKNWRQTIELTILAPVIAAIQRVAPQIEGATLDLGRRAVVIGSPTPIIGPEWKRVRDVGKETIRSIISRDSAIQIAQPRPSTYGYTFHSPSDAIRDHLRQFCQITEFTVDLAAIESLAEAYAELGERSKFFDLVVAFALGGVPAMNFITVSAFEALSRSAEPSMLLNEMHEKFHVFPGLQWEMVPESPQQLLTAWMDSLIGPKSALFFDTGTHGNGVRQLADILRDYVKDNEQSPFSRISVLGIVDGDEEAQRSFTDEVVDGTGTLVPFSVGYRHVQNVITEDREALAGYQSIRSAGIIQPYSKSLVLHIHREGRRITSVSSTSSGSLIHTLIDRKMQAIRQGGMEDPEFHNEIAGAILLSQECERESDELLQAIELGLLPKRFYRPALRALEGKYGKKFVREREMRKKGTLRKNDQVNETSQKER